MAEHNELGHWGENKAADFLERKGYSIIKRNWKYGHRDLDIIALDSNNNTLVIVEVKTRRNNLFAEPEQAVNYAKIKSLCIAANVFIKTHRISMPLRFDIITVIGTTDDDCEIHHTTDAFVPPIF